RNQSPNEQARNPIQCPKENSETVFREFVIWAWSLIGRSGLVIRHSMDRPLRILHLVLGADAGGLTRYVIDLGTAMHKLGHQIAAAGDTGAWQRDYDAAPFPFIRVPLKGGLLAFHNSARILRERLRANPVDAIHTHYRRATLLARRLQREQRV